MAVVNHSKREVNVKIVYVGRASGSATGNLTQIYQRLKPDFRGQERMIPMGGGTLHLCEFQLPGAGALPGFVTRYHLYTLTAPEAEDEQWRMVLKGADGIVFVMNPDLAMADANRSEFAGLLRRVNGLGIDLGQVPIVIQADQCQEGMASAEDEVLRQLAMPGMTVVPARTSRGDGVLETLSAVVRKVTAVLQRLEFPEPQSDEFVDNEDEPLTEPDAIAAEDDNRTVEMLSAMALPADMAADASMPLSLTPDGGVVEVPLRLVVSGLEKEYILSLSLREAGAVTCTPLRGAAYVR